MLESEGNCTLLIKVCWTTAGAAIMLATKVLLLEAVSSSEAGIFSIDSEETPATSVPRDSREAPLLICLIHLHLSNRHIQFTSVSFYM